MSNYDVGLPTASFGINAYRQMALSAGTDNVIASPFSIYLALLLAYAGAGGQSKAEFESTLNIKGQSRDQVLQGYGNSLKKLAHGQGSDAPFKLNIANNAFVEKRFPLKSQYTSDIKKYMGTTPSTEDFAGNAEAVRQKINKWAENATENKVKEPLKQGVLGPDTAMVLVNAIYFKSEWDVQFKRSDTEKRIFKSLNGQNKEVDMMFRTDELKYVHNKQAGYQFVSIPHKDKKNALLVILPDEGQEFKIFEKKLTPSFFADAEKAAKKQELKLGLPSFKFDQEYQLQKVLSDLGMPGVSANGADFSGISSQPVKISKVIHKAFIDVNEEGTEAAAFTGVVAVLYSLMITPEDVPKMICDRPFIFAIKNEEQNLLLFVGRVAKL